MLIAEPLPKAIKKWQINIQLWYHLHEAHANVEVKNDSNFPNLWQSIDDYSLWKWKWWLLPVKVKA